MINTHCGNMKKPHLKNIVLYFLCKLILIPLSIQICTAQDYLDRVVLKNGQVIEGIIVEQKPGQYFKVFISSQVLDTITVNCEETSVIQKIKREKKEIFNDHTIPNKEDDTSRKTKLYVFIASGLDGSFQYLSGSEYEYLKFGTGLNRKIVKELGIGLKLDLGITEINGGGFWI
jgi:hypothetical protein